jgi:hypothetical protein
MGDSYGQQKDAILDAGITEDGEQAEWLKGFESIEELLKFTEWTVDNISTSPGADMPYSVMRTVPLAGLIKMEHFEVTSKGASGEILRKVCPSRLHKTAWDGRPPEKSFYPMLRRLIRDELVEKTILRLDELDGEVQVRVHKVELTLKGLAYAAKHGVATMDDVRIWYDTNGVGPEKTSNHHYLARLKFEERLQERRRERALEERLGEGGKKTASEFAKALEPELKKLEKATKGIGDQLQSAQDRVERLTTAPNQTLLETIDKDAWRYAEYDHYVPKDPDPDSRKHVGLVTKWIIDGKAATCFSWLHPEQQEEVAHQVFDMSELGLPEHTKRVLATTIFVEGENHYKNLVNYHERTKEGPPLDAAREVDELILRVTWAIVRRVMDYRMGDPRYAPPQPPRDTSVMEKGQLELRLELKKKGYEFKSVDEVVRTRRRKKNL